MSLRKIYAPYLQMQSEFQGEIGKLQTDGQAEFWYNSLEPVLLSNLTKERAKPEIAAITER